MSAIATTKPREQGTVKLWLILVGVNHYQDPHIRDLKYCANDAQELGEALQIATDGFQQLEITALYDGSDHAPTLAEITTSIQKLRFAKSEDTVLFFFSGHGYLDSNHQPVLCVADTELANLEGTGLRVDVLLKELRQCDAKRQLVWLDACQEQQDSTQPNPMGQLRAVLEQQAERSQNFYAMLSCDKTERSFEISELKHGLFTYCLIEGLRGKAANSQSQIHADRLFRYVERRIQKWIQYKQHPVEVDNSSKGMDFGIDIAPMQPKPSRRLPLGASQTPQRIVKGGGEWIIGLATSPTQRKALIVDQLSASLADIKLCKILQARGSFEVAYYQEKDKRKIQQLVEQSLQETSNKTVLLYLVGTIEANSSGYELVCSAKARLNLQRLAQQLRDSPVQEIIIIADIFDPSTTPKSLAEILQPNPDQSLCLITATTTVPNQRKFLQELITILATAGESVEEFWATELITQLQKWCRSQPDILLKPWLSGSTEVMEILSVEVQRSYDETFEIEVCPYKSLEAFTQDDAYFFHGREDLVAEILQKLHLTSFLAVVGASGSGKSSVLMAGVIPKLRTEELLHQTDPEFQFCQTWTMLPGKKPLVRLAEALAPNQPEFLKGVLYLGVESWVSWLRRQPQSLSVLVIDQFEELFTLTKETDRFKFLELILDAVKEAQDCFKVIITLRIDFLNKCLDTDGLAPLVKQSQVLVPSCRLEDNQYRQMIVLPAQKVGLEVEEGLIAILLRELEAGSLPLLQYALEELWQKHSRGKLTVEDYQQHIGKLGKFLSSKAEETYKSLSPAQQECAQSLFLSLVFLGREGNESQKDTRRRLSLADLSVGKYHDVFPSTLQALVKARLLMVSREDSQSSLVVKDESLAGEEGNLAVTTADGEVVKEKVTVEVAHEILLRDWDTLKGWLEEHREKYRLRAELRRKAEEWKGDGILLSKGALAKYEEFQAQNANELSSLVNEFVGLSIERRDLLAKQEEERTQRELEKERKARINAQRFVRTLVISLIASLGWAGLLIWQWHESSTNFIKSLSKSAELLLASGQESDALVAGLKTGRKIQNSSLGVDSETQVELSGRLQSIFYKIQEFNRLEAHTKRVTDIVFSPDGQIVASTDSETVKLWNLQGELLKTLEDPTRRVTDIVFSPDGQIIAFEVSDHTVKLQNLQGEWLKTKKPLKSSIDKFTSIVFSPNGQIIAFGNDDGTVKLRNLQGEWLENLKKRHESSVTSIVFSPNGQIIAFSNNDGIFKLQDLQEEKLFPVENGSFEFTKYGRNVVFSPNSQTIAFVNRDNTINLLNLQEKSLETFPGHADDINTVVFSPNGQTIASGSDDGTVKLWSLQGKILETFPGHADDVNSVVFSPNGQTIASGSDDGTVKLWSLQGKILGTFSGHTEAVNTVVFSPNGQTIASGSDDGTVKLWSLDLDEVMKRGCSSVVRDYLNHNPNISPEDRKICDGISSDPTFRRFLQEIRLFSKPHSTGSLEFWSRSCSLNLS